MNYGTQRISVHLPGQSIVWGLGMNYVAPFIALFNYTFWVSYMSFCFCYHKVATRYKDQIILFIFALTSLLLSIKTDFENCLDL